MNWLKSTAKSLFLLQGVRKKYLLFTVNGFLLATLLYFYMEDNYESQLFHALATYIQNSNLKNNSSPDSLLAESLHLTYSMGRRRQMVFGDQEIQSIKSDLIHPVTFDLMTTKGSCGSYSMILSRVLTELDIENRIAQMKDGNEYGSHIVVEAKTNEDWVVLDPSYNLYFIRPDGKMASFADVSSNWDYFKNQVPENYDKTYRYEGVRYTNWNKIPVIMPMMKTVLDWTMGKKKADAISLRVYTIRKFRLLFSVTLGFYLIFVFIILRDYAFKKQNVTRLQPVNSNHVQNFSPGEVVAGRLSSH